MKLVKIAEYDNGYVVDYHDADGKYHEIVLTTKAELKAKLLEVFA